MSEATLDRLKHKIDGHYNYEAEIMLEMINSDLTKKERDELLDFMNNHPYSKVAKVILTVRDELRKPHTS